MAKKDWDDGYYLRGFQLAEAGKSEKQMAEAFGVSVRTMRAWKETRPAFRAAIESGRKRSKESTVVAARNASGITEKELRFCEVFVQTLNLRESALQAGFGNTPSSAAVMGTKLLKKDYITKEIQHQLLERRENAKISKERILTELALIAFSNPQEMLDENGEFKNLVDMPEGIVRALSGFEVELYEDKDGNRSTRIKPKFWDKLKALELLARHIGIIQMGGVNLNVEDKSQHLHLEGAHANPYALASEEAILQAKGTLERIKQEVLEGVDDEGS